MIFQQKVKERRRTQAIKRIIREDGVEFESQQDIENEAIRYYKTLFSASHTQ